MHIIGKIWGSTRPLLVTPFIEVHRISIKPNAFCSMHKHEHKWNAFFVISGTLRIVIEKDYGLTDVTVLNADGFTTVKPGNFHKFETGDEPVEALEIYYPEPLTEDIVRRVSGGLTTQAANDSTDNNVIGFRQVKSAA